ncbi:MAG: filamentous hemagglutinin N-terminal domain-containing protein [Candidatus Scalindua sp.]|nr:filamentous hemagglutinin N-terminal domain-containing protein [Candidatus Scalindua sp.]
MNTSVDFCVQKSGGLIPITQRFYEITDGTHKGSNLFHSFSKFDVPAGEAAKFIDVYGDVNNIISRVTGPEISKIDGRIESPAMANLFFLNPNGVVFGPEASLNINGSFHVSTANYLRFGDGAKFYADFSHNSTLTVANPAAFGFFNNNPSDIGTIQVNGSTLNIFNDKKMSFVGGNIKITDGGILNAPGGQINIASAASGGEVVLHQNGIEMQGFQNQGTIEVIGRNQPSQPSQIKVTPTVGEGENSAVYIRGGKFLMSKSNIFANKTNASNQNDVGNSIDIELTGDFESSDDSIRSRPLGIAKGGGIRIEAKNIQLDSTEITAQSFPDESTGDTVVFGSSGDIELIAMGEITMSGFSRIDTSTQGAENTGDAGNIEIKAGSVVVDSSSSISSKTTSKGNGGLVKVNADSIAIDGVNSSVSAETSGTGVGGDVNMNAKLVNLTTGGVMSTDSEGVGKAGGITVTSNKVSISGAGSSISSSAQGIGDAGSVELKDVESLALSEGGVISTDSAGEGSGGDITVTSNSISMTGPRTAISSTSEGLKDAGSITINTNNIVMNDKSSITTDAAKASGGGINLTVHSQMYLIDSEITSSVNGGVDTEGGNITMNLNRGVLENSKIIANAFEGKGGKIQITADVFLADPQSKIDATSEQGIDGEVDIRAPVTNISGNIVPLKDNFSSATSLLLQPCAVRMSGGERSSLVMAGRDGLPMQPGDLMPGPLYDEAMAAADAKMAGMNERSPLSYGANTFEEKGLLPLDLLDGDMGCPTCP